MEYTIGHSVGSIVVREVFDTNEIFDCPFERNAKELASKKDIMVLFIKFTYSHG